MICFYKFERIIVVEVQNMKFSLKIERKILVMLVDFWLYKLVYVG